MSGAEYSSRPSLRRSPLTALTTTLAFALALLTTPIVDVEFLRPLTHQTLSTGPHSFTRIYANSDRNIIMSSYATSSFNTSASYSYTPPSPTGMSFGLHQSPRDQHSLFAEFGVLSQRSASGDSNNGSKGFGSLKKLIGRK